MMRLDTVKSKVVGVVCGETVETNGSLSHKLPSPVM